MLLMQQSLWTASSARVSPMHTHRLSQRCSTEQPLLWPHQHVCSYAGKRVVDLMTVTVYHPLYSLVWQVVASHITHAHVILLQLPLMVPGRQVC